MKRVWGVLAFIVVCSAGYSLGLVYKNWRQQATQDELLQDQAKEVHRRDPDSPVAALIRELAEGKPPRALSEEDKTRVSRLHNEAVEFAQANRLPLALEKYREMTKLDPRNVEAHVGFAEAALQQLRWARGYEPSTHDQAYLDILGDHMKAAGLLAPENYEVMLLAAHYQGYIGNLYLASGDPKGAEDRFGRASRVLEDAMTIHGADKLRRHQLTLELCGILRYRKAYSEALSKLDTLLADTSINPAVAGHLQFNRALVLADMGDEKRALEAFDLALKPFQEPPHAILLHRAKFLQDRGYKNLALRDFEILGTMDPKNAYIRAKIEALKASSAPEPEGSVKP